MTRQQWIWVAAGAAVAVGLWWWSRRPQDPTSAPTALIVGNAGVTPVIDDLSDGAAIAGVTAKAIV